MKKYLTLIILLQLAVTSFAAGPRVSSTSDGVNNLRVIECAYLIGSFNDWKLPDGDDLNGAKKIDFYRDYTVERIYRWRGTLPAGDVSFMVYVPESANLTEVDYSGYYTTPCRQFPIYEPDQEYDGRGSVDFWCERGTAPDISKACMIPDWSGEEVEVWFTAWSRDYMDGICFELSVSGDSRPIPTPDDYYFIASVNGGEPEVFDMGYLHLGGPDAKYEYHYRGYYMQHGYIYDAVTISGYFSPEPSLDVDPSRCLGACGPDTLTLDPSVNIGPFPKDMTWRAALYLSPGKNPVTVNIISGEKVRVSGLNIYEWTVEFVAFEKQGSVEGVSVDTSNQIVISDHTVTVPIPTQIDVYSLGGVKVRSDYGTRLDLGDLGHGTYIVRAGAFSRKVAL